MSGIGHRLEGCRTPVLDRVSQSFREAGEKAAEAYVLSRGKARFLSTAQAIRATLLATATVTSRAGLRSSNWFAQVLTVVAFRRVYRMTAVAPTTRRCRK
ncbi:hypothetical protein EN803_38700, partial [Mesorhizobium sp. M2D.F.Ca.ET.160.01.1.1]